MTTTEKAIVYAAAQAYYERSLIARRSLPQTYAYWGGAIDGIGDVARDLLGPPAWIALDARAERLHRLWAAAGLTPARARERWVARGMGR